MTLPVPRIAWPVTLDSSNNLILFSLQVAGSGAYSNGDARLTVGTYTTPEDLVDELWDVLDAGTGSFGLSDVTLSDAGFITISLTGLESGTAVRFPWTSVPPWQASTAYPGTDGIRYVSNDTGKVYKLTANGTSAGSGGPTGTAVTGIADNTAEWGYVGTTSEVYALSALLGFTANYTVSGTDGTETLTADRQLPNLWTPNVPVRSDTERELTSHVNVVETADGKAQAIRWTPSSLDYRRTRRTVRFEFLQPHKVWTADATGSNAGQAFESFWRDATKIVRFTYSPDRSAPSTDADEWFLVEESARNALADVERMGDTVDLHALEFTMGLYVE
jgi:hypothetical protein